jgi:enamine deaminase RidA (YjgF/YER057c/UK114 family)
MPAKSRRRFPPLTSRWSLLPGSRETEDTGASGRKEEMKDLSRADFMKAGVATVASLGLIGALGNAKSSAQGQGSEVDIERKLKELKMPLPKAPKPVGAYVAARKSGNLLFISGQLPFVEGKLLYQGGKVGREVSIEQGQGAFRICALNALAQAKAYLGDLGKISGILKIVGYLCCAEGFVDHAKVLNGASEFFAEVLGKEVGAHTRMVMGVESLPLGTAVALEVTMEVAEG